ncbi:MAG TPA: hypothetical protein VGD98_23450 [Ktedonobacteraceae bacterium]
MAYSYQEICQGEEPWIALGNFMNAWHGDAKTQRLVLVKDPLVTLENITPELQKWATFIAASVEWFCKEYDLPCPTWIYNPTYNLSEPWFYSIGADREKVRQQLMRETPEPFTRRNIYCGKDVSANKYELGKLIAEIREIKARKAQSNLASTSHSAI